MHKPVLALATVAVAAAATAPIAAAAPATRALKTAHAVIKATDRAPILESRAMPLVAGKTAYASYSDSRTDRAASYLEGDLVQLTVNSNLYALDGKCFKHQELSQFAGLTRLANDLLPMPTKAQPVSYSLTGHTLHWREPASAQHSAETGTVTFNSADRITADTTSAYTYKTTKGTGVKKVNTTYKAAKATIAISYPKALPASIPNHKPTPACKPA